MRPNPGRKACRARFTLARFPFPPPPESRSILLPVVLHHIHLHLRQQRELLICSGILSSIFSIIKTSSMVFPSSQHMSRNSARSRGGS